MERIKPKDERILLVRVEYSNLWHKVRGLQSAYDYISDWSGHFTYQIVDVDTRETIEQGRI